MRRFAPVRSPLANSTAREFPNAEFPNAVGIAYYAELAGKHYVKCYSGKRNRPDIYYWCRTAERAQAAIQAWAESLEASAKARATRNAERAAFVHTLNVGDVLVASWGYDQTNIDYYQVVATTAKTVDIREIGCEAEETGFMSGRSVPAVGQFVGDKVTRHKVGQGNSVKVSSCAYAHPLEYKEVEGVRVYRSHGWTAYA